MGGTSADVAVVDGEPRLSTENYVGDFPVIMPAIDVTSIGAGGGSIAWTDQDGVLKVGPQSAGARPGPACYGLGGTDATVTDAYVTLGIIEPRRFLGGSVPLDPALAEQAVAALGQRLGKGDRRDRREHPARRHVADVRGARAADGAQGHQSGRVCAPAVRRRRPDARLSPRARGGHSARDRAAEPWRALRHRLARGRRSPRLRPHDPSAPPAIRGRRSLAHAARGLRGVDARRAALARRARACLHRAPGTNGRSTSAISGNPSS